MLHLINFAAPSDYAKAGALIAALAFASFSSADLRVTSRLTTDDGQGKKASSNVTTLYRGHMIRTESGDSIRILDTRTSVLTVLDPKAKTYRQIPLKELGKGAQGLEGMKMKATASVKPLNEKAKLLGAPAQRYQGTATLTMTFPKMPSAPSRSMKMSFDCWANPAIKVPSGAALQGAFGGSGSALQIMGADAIYKEMAKVKGLPMASTSSVRAEAGKSPTGKAITMTTSMKVLSYEQKPLDKSLFEIPKGYKKISVQRTPPGKPGDGHGHGH